MFKEVEGEDWKLAYFQYAEARDQYITCARRSLQVRGLYISDSQRGSLHERLMGEVKETVISESLLRLPRPTGED